MWLFAPPLLFLCFCSRKGEKKINLCYHLLPTPVHQPYRINSGTSTTAMLYVLNNPYYENRFSDISLIANYGINLFWLQNWCFVLFSLSVGNSWWSSILYLFLHFFAGSRRWLISVNMYWQQVCIIFDMVFITFQYADKANLFPVSYLAKSYIWE